MKDMAISRYLSSMIRLCMTTLAGLFNAAILDMRQEGTQGLRDACPIIEGMLNHALDIALVALGL